MLFQTSTMVRPMLSQTGTPIGPVSSQTSTPIGPTSSQTSTPIGPALSQTSTPVVSQTNTPIRPTLFQPGTSIRPTLSQPGTPTGPTLSQLSTLVGPTQTQSIWLTKTKTDNVLGTNRVILSNQSAIVKGIVQEAIDNVRCYVLFEHTFPNTTVLPAVIWKALVKAAYVHMTLGGHHNPLIACVHQRLLSDDEYQDKVTHLVSTTVLPQV